MSFASEIGGKTLISRLSFTHLVELIVLEDATKRAFYEAECIRGNWSVRELKRQPSIKDLAECIAVIRCAEADAMLAERERDGAV